MTTGINPPDDDSDDAGGTTGKNGETTTTSGPGETTTTGESGVEDESGSTGGSFACEAPTTCNSADTIGGVSGDSATPPLTETGTEPIWVQVEVSENDSGVFSNDMQVTVSLQSSGGDWDLKAFLGGPGDANGCGGAEQRSETDGVDTISYTWGESGTFANNVDDSTFVAVEIFPKEGVCAAGSSWTLTVTGN